MNHIRTAATTIIFLLFAAFACAQEPRDEPKPPQQEESKPESKHEASPPRQNEVKPPKHDEEKPSKQEKQESAKPPREDAKPAHEHGEQAQEPRHGRPAGKSAHIPDEKFRANFGRQHTVVINRPVIVEGRPRFQYSGYWFEIVDVWPADWAYTDGCYIDYVDGEYFLFDLLHPGVRIALFVVM
jgi:hypothetical protein